MVDLKREAHVGASLGLFWALTRAYSLLGDPGGRLETCDDLAEFADSLRTEPVVRSRGGMFYTSSYDVCATVLKSPDASADIPEARTPL